MAGILFVRIQSCLDAEEFERRLLIASIAAERRAPRNGREYQVNLRW
jgi:hypothetical protein